jgi:hypothetical protein
MLMTTREKRPASRTLRGWAIAVLQEAGAIKECEEHGWMQDRADPHASQRAFDNARVERPPGFRRKRQRSQSPRCWIRLATGAPNARRPRRRARDVFFSDKPLFDFLTEVPRTAERPVFLDP